MRDPDGGGSNRPDEVNTHAGKRAGQDAAGEQPDPNVVAVISQTVLDSLAVHSDGVHYSHRRRNDLVRLLHPVSQWIS